MKLVYGHTCNQTFHLLLSKNVHVKSLFQLVIVFKSPSTGSHNTQVILGGPIDMFMLLLQLPNKVDATIDPMCLEARKVQSTPIIRRAGLARKVDQFRQGTTNLYAQDLLAHSQLKCSRKGHYSHRQQHGSRCPCDSGDEYHWSHDDPQNPQHHRQCTLPVRQS